MEALRTAILRNGLGEEFKASDLWGQHPTVVLVLRRPGCVLCRAEAQKLWAMREQLAEVGGARLVCVVKEWRDAEIAAFTPEYWGGPVFLDTSMAFYKAVNGGENVLRGSVSSLLNPFSSAWKRILAARKEVASHNVVGEGLIMGGLLVVGAGGTGPYFVHLETDLGVHASHDEVLAAVRRAAADVPGAGTAPAAAA